VKTSDSDVILRFRACERHLHWALAIPFMVSWTTAIVLVTVYNPHPDRPYRLLFSWTHRASGIWLSLLPLWVVVTHRRDFRTYLENVREAWLWTVDDLKWLALMGPSTFSSKIALPHQGKFNAAEKINFMTVTATYPLYIVTGVLIWMPGVALAAWLVHFSMALVATPLVLGHIFMATVNPDTRVGLSGMITGFVSREWAKHHYHHWYMKSFERADDGAAAATTRAAAPRVAPMPTPRPAPRPAPRLTRPPAVVRAAAHRPLPDSM
jgi:formate dehydrogenase subunit gamma